jgi:2-methylcitrate dehydratase PrpD
MAAQYSLPFVVGATLEFGPTDFGAFAPENLDDAEILRWADLVKVEFDQELQAKYPDHFGSEVETVFADGRVRTERVLDSRGTPARPFTWQHLREKAANLTAACEPPLDIDLLEAVVRSLREAKNVDAYEKLLTVEITSGGQMSGYDSASATAQAQTVN